MEAKFITGYPGDAEFAKVESVLQVNFRPHAFTIDPKIVAGSNGLITTEVCDRIGCGHRVKGRGRCNLPTSMHTHDTVAFIKLLANVQNATLVEWVRGLDAWTKQHGIDGVAFLQTPYTIMPDAEGNNESVH